MIPVCQLRAAKACSARSKSRRSLQRDFEEHLLDLGGSETAVHCRVFSAGLSCKLSRCCRGRKPTVMLTRAIMQGISNSPQLLPIDRFYFQIHILYVRDIRNYNNTGTVYWTFNETHNFIHHNAVFVSLQSSLPWRRGFLVFFDRRNRLHLFVYRLFRCINGRYRWS